MYINPFVAGVLTTLFIEVTLILIIAVSSYVKKKNKEEK